MQPLTPVTSVTATSSTKNAAFEMLMNAVGNMLGPVVHQLITSDPSLVQIKGWHGMTALHRACLIGDYNIVLMLVQANSDVNALTSADESPLHYASKRGVPTIVHLLVQCGAKIDCLDKRGRNVVHHAAENGAVQVIKYFEDAFGMKFKDVDAHSQSPLHIACSLGHLDVCRFLIDKQRCDLLQADADGNLPIHLTAKEGLGHLTWLLLSSAGVAMARARNRHGFTPLALSLQSDKRGHKDTSQLLSQYQHGADNMPVTGPVYTWYFLLLYPFVLFTVLIILTHIFTTYQYVIFFIAMIQVLIQVKGLTPRLQNVSRWPNPFFVGLFTAGILHTIICFFWLIFIHVYQNAVFLMLSTTVIPGLLLMCYKFIVQDPGVCKISARDPQTGKSLSLVDLCRMQKPNYYYCHVCDTVNNLLTKHCKLCDFCVHWMDHHCLFLLKCVAQNNHAIFVWLIILAFINMCLYCLSFGIYLYTLYGHMDYSFIIRNLFHSEMWPFSIAILNVVSAFWSFNLVSYQYVVVSKGCTSYFGEEFHRDKILTTRQRIENFVYFLLYRPLPHKNPYSPFVMNSEMRLTV